MGRQLWVQVREGLRRDEEQEGVAVLLLTSWGAEIAAVAEAVVGPEEKQRLRQET